jgi:transcriptional regulator with XRE-family HTH domain
LDANMSQEDLARSANVASSYVSKLERGLIARPGAEALRSIAQALSIPLGDLIGDEAADRLERPARVKKAPAEPPPRAIAHPADGPTPSYAVAIPVVAVANAGRGGGIVEEWAFMPFEDTQGRSLRAYRAAGGPRAD